MGTSEIAPLREGAQAPPAVDLALEIRNQIYRVGGSRGHPGRDHCSQSAATGPPVGKGIQQPAECRKTRAADSLHVTLEYTEPRKGRRTGPEGAKNRGGVNT